MGRWLIVLGALVGCGRVDFDSISVDQGLAHSLLRIDRVPNTATLDSFPILVVLDDTRADRTHFRADASDVRFRGSDGALYQHEIEQVGRAGGPPLIAWVLIPTISGASTTFTVEYGREPDPVGDSVFTGRYEAVWHMNGTGDVADATEHHRTGTNVGTTSSLGRIGDARGFDGTSFVRVDNQTVPLTNMTISGWFNGSMFGKSESLFSNIVTREFGTTEKDDFLLGFNDTHASGLLFHESGMFVELYDGASIGPDEWHHAAMTWDASVGTLYLDGDQVAQQNDTDGSPAVDTNPIFIGTGNNASGDPEMPDDDFAIGSIDEVRIEHEAHDAAWITMDYASQTDAAITYGAVEYD